MQRYTTVRIVVYIYIHTHIYTNMQIYIYIQKEWRGRTVIYDLAFSEENDVVKQTEDLRGRLLYCRQS